MERLIKLLFFISVIILIGMTMYVYALLPNVVVLPNSFGAFSLSKEAFFYSSMGAFIILILLASFFTFTIKGITSNEGSFFDIDRKNKIVAWSSTLRLIISIFFTMSITFIGMFQNDEHYDISNFAFLVYLGPILLIIWFFSIFFLLSKKQLN